jgi:Uma2 family endonuclease
MPTRVVLTYQDFAALPADRRRYELHEGELSMTAAPVPDHQHVVLELAVVLREFVNQRQLGKVFISPIDCILSDITVVEPDIVYLATDRLAAVSSRGIEGPPTLAVEILSPSTAHVDRGVKLQLYARHRVPYYWIVDLGGHAIEAYALRGEAYELAARAEGSQTAALPPFPDLQLDVTTLWA